jgi:hypothetical protein
MKFKVLAHTPAGSVQHIVQAADRDAAREKVRRAHPKAEMIQVEPAWGESPQET